MISTQLRLPDDLHVKARVLAALKNLSLNALVVEALQEKVDLYEKRYGELPKPPAGA